jgi:hypothetical protein
MNGLAVKPGGAALAEVLRAQARAAPESGIVAAMNYGRLHEGLIPLWAGEGDLPTPAFICEAATRSLAAGETFYTWQRGIPPLREALARYHARLYGRDFSPEEFYVTGSGMQAIQIVLASVVGAGDEVLIPSPTWPNCAAAAGITGARPVEVPMPFGNDGWSLDLDRLAAAVTARAPARPVDRRRRDLCALLVWRRRARAVLLRRDGGAGPRPVRQHVLQELGHDRLAHRLDRGVSLARPGD